MSRGGVAALLAALIPLAGCGAAETPALPSGEVVLYTSMPDSIVGRLQGVIENRFPDLDGDYWLPGSRDPISLRVIRGRTADIEARIESEIAMGGMRADVIWLAEPSAYERYKERGLLAPYAPPPDAPIPTSYIDEDGFYVAGRVISMLIAWNTDRRSEPVSDWTDLQTIQATAFPAPASGAARATIVAIMGRHGLDYFRDLHAAGAVAVTSNGDARDGLVGGMFEAVAVLDYMARQAKADGSSIEFAYPESGTLIIPSPIAIAANSANPEAAKAVVDFVLSQAGQEIIVNLGNFYPARTDVAPPAGAPPLEEIAALHVDWADLADQRDAITTFWEDIFRPATTPR